MIPLEFLKQEFENVERALNETLRHEYGPAGTLEYYEECVSRLAEIKRAIPVIQADDAKRISEYLVELSSLGHWKFLIERSHLGEFSWPFADELRRMATELLSEINLKGEQLKPIIHIVAAGEGYQIVYEETQVPPVSGGRRFVIVAFPRSLKHHVLLHMLFGHEVGHAALETTVAGDALLKDVVAKLTVSGPMSDETSVNKWLNANDSPIDVKSAQPHYLSEDYLNSWIVELTCDLIGLILFGPGFLAAYRAYLEPSHPNAYEVDPDEPTHPPYAVRYRMLVQAMHLLGWNKPITRACHRACRKAETELLNYILNNPYDSWATVFDDSQLRKAIRGVQTVFSKYGNLGYTRIDADILVALVERLAKRLPPLQADIDSEGRPQLTKIDISQTLYSGWIYWVGRSHFGTNGAPDFFTTNRLCDHALLQQCAVNNALDEGVT